MLYDSDIFCPDRHLLVHLEFGDILPEDIFFNLLTPDVLNWGCANLYIEFKYEKWPLRPSQTGQAWLELQSQ